MKELVTLLCPPNTGNQKGILMHKPQIRTALLVALLASFLSPLSPSVALSQPLQRKERVLIKTPKPYTAVVSRIHALGGKVRNQYEFIDAIAADIPGNAMEELRTLTGPGAIFKDSDIPAPRKVVLPRGTGLRPVANKKNPGSRSLGTVFPSGNPSNGAYQLNLAGLNLKALHADGKTGKGVIVAVIDSGIRPGFPALELDGSVIGCENFVDDDGDGVLDGACRDSANDPHGTFIAGMISANANVDIGGSPMLEVIKQNLPAAIAGQSTLPLIGSAPLSNIYALRVFGANAFAGAPKSRIIEAIERVIRLKKRGTDISVCNLSLGTVTLEAGADPLDVAVDALMANGILPVVAVGNVGPSSLTASTPASSKNSLSVAAASRTANERIYWDYLFGAGTGFSQRPVDNTIQTATFSSRGPHADGRIDPDVIVNGFGNVGQGYAGTNDVSAEAGTSFSTPLVSGIAAVLIQAFPRMDPIQILNAIVMSANPNRMDDGSTQLDQGNGFVDAQAAYDLLKAGRVPTRLPESFVPSHSVRNNIERGTDLRVMDGTISSQPSGGLKPAQRFDILYFVKPDTERVVINLSHFRKNTPDPGPNDAFFRDDISLNVHSAETSSIGAFGDYLLCDPDADPETSPCPPFFGVFTRNGQFVIKDPEPGVMRITLVGSTTNRGNVSADVSVSSDVDPLPRFTAQGTIKDGKDVVLTVHVPKNVRKGEFRLNWGDDWANYPTSDVDMTVFDPAGNPILVNGRNPGATLNHPERVLVTRPAEGDWIVLIKGFDIPAGKDEYILRVILDGTVVK